MMRLKAFILGALVGLLCLSCVPENHSNGAPELSFDRMTEMKAVLEQTLAEAIVGDLDGEYPQASYDDLKAALAALKKGISQAKAGEFILQFEVDNFVNAAEKALTLFKNSVNKSVEVGAPAELFVNGIDHKGYIDFGSSSEYDPANFTVELWTKHSEDFIEFTFGSLISTFISPIPYKGWTLHYWGVANSLIRLSVGTNNANPDLTLPTLYTTAPTNYGEWFHVAGVYDTKIGRMSLYINGELKTSYDLPDLMVPGTTESELRMWAFVEPLDQARCCSGYIKRFRLWSSAKSESEIKALMDTDVSGTESGLVCAWDFDVKPENDEAIVDKTGRHTAKIVGVYKWYETK